MKQEDQVVDVSGVTVNRTSDWMGTLSWLS
jgi:hypothetical protein